MTIINFILGALLVLLKIIGIILLVILGLLLLIICVVLFIPVRYRAKGEFDTEASHISGEAGISWLLHIISVRIWFSDDNVRYHGRIFGIKLINSEKLKNKADKPDRRRKKDKQNTLENEKIENEMPQQDNLLSDTHKGETENVSEDENINIANETSDAVHTEILEADGTDSTEDNETLKRGRFSKLFEAKDKVYVKFNNIKFKIINICDRIKHIDVVRQSYMDFLTTEESRRTLRELKERLFKVLCHIKPTKFKLALKFGLTDPAATGQIYGMMSVLLLTYSGSIKLEPQFTDVEKAFAEGNFKLKGRIRLIVLLVHAVKIYTNKRLKEFIAFVRE